MRRREGKPGDGNGVRERKKKKKRGGRSKLTIYVYVYSLLLPPLSSLPICSSSSLRRLKHGARVRKRKRRKRSRRSRSTKKCERRTDSSSTTGPNEAALVATIIIISTC